MKEQRKTQAGDLSTEESDETLALFSERLDAATPCGGKAEEATCGNARKSSAEIAHTGMMRGNNAKGTSPRATKKIEEAVSAAADRARTKQHG